MAPHSCHPPTHPPTHLPIYLCTELSISLVMYGVGIVSYKCQVWTLSSQCIRYPSVQVRSMLHSSIIGRGPALLNKDKAGPCTPYGERRTENGGRDRERWTSVEWREYASIMHIVIRIGCDSRGCCIGTTLKINYVSFIVPL